MNHHSEYRSIELTEIKNLVKFFLVALSDKNR
jgi:hypothetical protein